MSTPPVVPVIVLAGQSNVIVTPLDNRIVSRLHNSGGAFEFVELAEGATSIYQNPSKNDWSALSQGELLDQLVQDTLRAVANVEAQGGQAEVTLLFVQGESDRLTSASDYAVALSGFIDAFRTGIDQPNAEIILAELSFASGVRTAQRMVAADKQAVETIVTEGLPIFDGIHYTDGGAGTIIDRFFNITDVNAPVIDGYTNLLNPGSLEVLRNVTVYHGPDFLATEFIRSDAASYNVTTSSGDDRILTGSGRDVINGGVGADYIDTAAGDDRIIAGRGDDRVFGRDGNDFISGLQGDDRVLGGNGNDTILLGDQDDLGYGDAGNDILNGGEGRDFLWGGSGTDIFAYGGVIDSRPGRNDLIRDFEQGADVIDLSALGPLQFNGQNGFTGGGAQLVYSVVDGRTILEVDIHGDRIADFVIFLTGEIQLNQSDFILG